MSVQLREVYSIQNLRRAWRWIKTNPDPLYKKYFRDIYQAYAVAEEENIAYLHNKLKINYSPSNALKVYFPKKSGILRPYTLLTIEDQILYQAIINIIADRLILNYKKSYLKTNYGHLYAGKKSRFFYKNWKKCYKSFSDNIKTVFKKGYIYSASFDLTACYDSIDNNVLKYFLKKLYIEDDVTDILLKCLQNWTKAYYSDPIYQGHGIPQGPLSSGLLSEVILTYFDKTSGNRRIKYFRYVDDIRIFAKSEQELRRALVRIDVYSKKIGLFPQTGKINIHKIIDINDEIKTISNPPETSVHPILGNQRKARKRLKDLTYRYKINNETRFKYVLGGIIPNNEISIRLIKILNIYPHLYEPIFRYFKKYKILPSNISAELLNILKKYDLYYTFTAELIRTVLDRLPKRHIPIYVDQIKIYTKYPNWTGVIDLKTASFSFLIKYNEIKYSNIEILIKEDISWWAKVQFLKNVNYEYIGGPSSEKLLNEAITVKEDDTSMYSSYLMGLYGYRLISNYRHVNNMGLITLNKFGITKAKYAIPCGIEYSLKEMLGINPVKISWHTIYSSFYNEVTRRFILAKAYFQTDPNRWVQIMDTIHDALLNNLFKHDTSIGLYNLGKIGSVLQDTSRFALKYTKLHSVIKIIHITRLKTKEVHFITTSTGRKTTNIKYNFLYKTRKQLIEGYEELGMMW